MAKRPPRPTREPNEAVMAHAAEFRLSITRALGDQIAESLASLTPAPLDSFHISQLQRRGGVYQLYENGIFVYVGKAERSLPSRLKKHYQKLCGRLNVGEMTFSCLYVEEDLHAVAPEQLLITRYRDEGKAPWNTNGFGSNDPGGNRDRTVYTPEHFDMLHPANLEWVCESIKPGRYSLAEALKLTKKELPYLFRYQKAPFQEHTTIEVLNHHPKADELFQLIASAAHRIDPRWRITALPGYVIMYPNEGEFPYARKVYPNEQTDS